ncbi:hypothetical protein DL89DRAFT_258130 [Linderina pennispora]|uniref:DUF7719 domain-containing protein n=1 Tax=Linderina pennispora TaxID=61395 RepID=A0A1Y1W7B4_9FUNG|nr:uncharacterized protein DL89DRAFT_258130 [Linderina pennispora]ORX69044.1 hypothetical protein DL89DRAFT_258130 [Linderina pennispora]
MVQITEFDDENVPLIESMKELTPGLPRQRRDRTQLAQARLGPDGKPKYLIDDIPDHEKMRLIRESGVLKQMKQDGKEVDYDELDRLEAEAERAEDEIPTWMNALIYTLALSSVYGLFEALVSQQYSIEITATEILKRMLNMSPAIYFMVYVTYKFRFSRAMSLVMLVFACASGCYFVHLSLHAPRLGIMKRAPGLVTIWIYLTFMQDVRPAIINAFVVCAFWLADPFKFRL